MPRIPQHLFRLPLLLALCSLSSACTVIRVEPLKTASPQVCIEENPAVQVDDFLGVVERGFARHGIRTRRIQQASDSQCPAVLTYTAKRSWSVVTYLSLAELNIRDSQGQLLASAYYRFRGRGLLAVKKWQSTETKMTPVIDQMLAEVPRATP
ncbi:hypothetical protein A9179_02215 [Pseudomonas alcaligenes]|uniref:Lipoprotein n=1 Tax=Aquipseudomonas alcaligenes TaxID=43263 RepID=A0ABR7RVH6_AQUAC|nr:Sbal_3080 family lipoprotein [Pseudomonas alcaligenes]MBC9249083.1 hypothetical protein [Pseudomonas alcaligenes]